MGSLAFTVKSAPTSFLLSNQFNVVMCRVSGTDLFDLEVGYNRLPVDDLLHYQSKV